MLSHIKRFFEQHLEPRQTEENQEHRLNLAAFALMLEVARMDENVGEDELAVVAEAGERFLGLSAGEVQELIKLAQEEAKESTSLYQFTSLIHASYTEEQKFELLRLMWTVAFADGRIAALEEHLIRRVADLLYVPHVKFMQAKHFAEQAGN